ncbi:MAG: secondary thiamine-phosphate synthase enzyme YjbQ [Proteobacteria bacterium]|nr:secondary thiamine-phosphate synthase enzyme YjbQ [Pseudomonadota bacterium]MBU1388704.1 secondary thiamine-phosphate synthase enzyme YjbQ [Pseudomonadota bacterium]MBU1541914.1 secondary thiamine-phosphate synthase enzyme YjbQ [Pseudomonadota bacterium]MBU2480860.1 secondary thiamine-phosphate synthase enzyme YjbQ [Pseudomonadota bacterium]
MLINVKTHAQTQMIDITSQVQHAVKESGITDGLVHVYSMHTTAAITINENADPAVEADILKTINKVIPFDDQFKHMEGNSAAHIKVSLFGPSEIIPLENGLLILGTWQGIFFCEFDGPRNRKVNVKIIPG